MQTRTLRRLGLAAALGLAGVLPAAAVASATSPITTGSPTATAAVTAGTLSFVSAPGNITFPSLVLTGLDQTTTAQVPIDVSDSTGSGAGWNITATSTQFSNGTNTLPDNSVTVNAAPTDTCDTGATCVLASNSISYPYTLPAGTTAPTATKMFDAAVNTGMGNQTVTPTFTLSVPAGAYSGTYTSTVTFSLVTGP